MSWRAQQLRALLAFSEDRDSTALIVFIELYIFLHSPLFQSVAPVMGDTSPSSGFLSPCTYAVCRHKGGQSTHAHKRKIKFKCFSGVCISSVDSSLLSSTFHFNFGYFLDRQCFEFFVYSYSNPLSVEQPLKTFPVL